MDLEETSDPGISLWGSDSESTRDFNAARDDVIVRLIDRVEHLEARLDAQLPVRTLPSLKYPSLDLLRDYGEVLWSETNDN